MSKALVEVLNIPYYQFLYTDVKRILEYESRGDTRVRFVSKALRYRDDRKFRHVSLECRDHSTEKVYEKSWMNVGNEWREEFCITLPNIPYTTAELDQMENSLNDFYVIGLSDCRHHVSDLLRLCYPPI